MWAKIKKAVEEGKLGDRAKVSTAKPSPLTGLKTFASNSLHALR